MSDFRCYIRTENRFDLLAKAVASIPEFHDLLTIVDNSPDGLTGTWPCAVWRPPVPLTFTQSHNWWFADARKKGAQFIVWMHGDAEAVDRGHLRLLEVTRKCEVKWGTIFTSYDALATVNLDAIDAVGHYDVHFEKYCCDCDLYYRFALEGWQCIDSGIVTKHIGSATITSDPQLYFTNKIIHSHAFDYYFRKWGGDPGEERYRIPFNRPELFPTLKPVGVW